MPNFSAENEIKSNRLEWVWRLGSLIVAIVTLISVQYMQSNYVSKTKYEEDQKATATQLNSVVTTLNSVVTTLAVIANQKDTLADHEHRIRVLEGHP